MQIQIMNHLTCVGSLRDPSPIFVFDAADVVETLNDVTLCPKYYTISILADSAKRDVIDDVIPAVSTSDCLICHLSNCTLMTQCKINLIFQSQRPPNLKVVLEW